MSFELTKILPLLIYPLGLGLILLLVASLFSMASANWKPMIIGLIGFLILWLSSTPFFSKLVLDSLESEYPFIKVVDQPHADAILILGGFNGMPAIGKGEIELNDGIDRMFYALRLFRSGKAPLMILVGGGQYSQSEAEIMEILLVEAGISKDVMLLEEKSRNTYENGVNSVEIMKQHGINKVLLITSAFHMRRAQAVFEKLGVEVIPAATDYQVMESNPSILDWLPDADALAMTTLGIKEYLGWSVYWFRGWV